MLFRVGSTVDLTETGIVTGLVVVMLACPFALFSSNTEEAPNIAIPSTTGAKVIEINFKTVYGFI